MSSATSSVSSVQTTSSANVAHSDDAIADLMLEQPASFCLGFDDDVVDNEVTISETEEEEEEVALELSELSVKSVKDMSEPVVSGESASQIASEATLRSIVSTPSLQSLASSSIIGHSSAVDMFEESEEESEELECASPEVSDPASPPSKVTITAALESKENSLYTEDESSLSVDEDEMVFADVISEELDEESEEKEETSQGFDGSVTQEKPDQKQDEQEEVASDAESGPFESDDGEDKEEVYQDLVEYKGELEGEDEDDEDDDSSLSPVVQPNLISEFDYFHQNLATEAREEDPDDYDFFETAQGDPEPFQTPKLSPYSRAKSHPGSLLPAPPIRFPGPSGQFMQPPFPKQVPWDPEVSRQWANFWQWALYGASLCHAYGRGPFQPPTPASTIPPVPQAEPVTRQPNIPPQLWTPAGSCNLSSVGGTSGARFSSPAMSNFEFIDDASTASAPRHMPSFNANRNLDMQYQLQQQPRSGGAYTTRNATFESAPRSYPERAPSTGPSINSYKPRFYHNQTQQQQQIPASQPHHHAPSVRGPVLEAQRASNYVRQWMASDTNKGACNRKPPFLDHEVGPMQHSGPVRGADPEKQSLSDGADWYEFDSSDLRPSRGHSEGRGSRGGGYTRASRGTGGGGGRGYQQRPPVSSYGGGGKPFY